MNYKRILSNNSIKSTSSSGKGAAHSEEISELNGEIESLKEVIESLKTSIESRDTAIGKLAREKEKVFVELKSAQRTIRSLRQQLNDERTIFIKEKEYLAEEIQRLSKNKNTDARPQRSSKQKNIVEKEQEINLLKGQLLEKDETICKLCEKYMKLKDSKSYIHRKLQRLKIEGAEQKNIVEKEQEINLLKGQLLEKDETICKLCEKYMKLKDSKSYIHRKLQRLKIEGAETRRLTLSYLEENKRKIDKTFRKMLKSSSVSLDGKKYLKLLKQNIKLSTENTKLKIGLSTNIHIDDKSDTKLYEHHDDSSIVDKPLPQLPELSREKIVPSEEDLYSGSKQHRRKLKWHPFKLKKSNDWFSPALLGSLYRKNKSLSAQLLQESLRKSTSMPCLSLV